MRARRLHLFALALLLALSAGLAQARVAAKPNLKVAAVKLLTTSAPHGATVSASVTTRNVGAAKAGKSKTAFFLSRDARKDAGDARIGTVTVPGLKPRKASTKTAKLTVPPAQAPGAYRVIACADAAKKVREKSERDNCRTAASTLTVTVPQQTTPPGPGETPAPGEPTPNPNPNPNPNPTPTDPSVQIQAARDAADGPVSLPIADVTVTYVKPALGVDVAGFFVQAAQAGPALFVAVDPATLSPSPVVGDKVSFTATAMTTTGGLRAASSISGFSRSASGVSVAPLLQAASSLTDLVSSLSSYESELIGLTATVSSAFAAAGVGHESAQIDTTGISGDTNLRLRLPATLRDSLDLQQGCNLTLNQGPMWRFNAQAQPSAYASGDVTVNSCPAPKVVSAIASSTTSVTVNFDRHVLAGSVNPDGSQFTADNGLTFSAASVSGRSVTLTSSTQTGGQSYTVQVAGTVTDELGSGLDPGADSAMFNGFVQPAVLKINEVAPNITGAADLIELKVVSGGTIQGSTVTENLSGAVVLATLPATNVATGDLIVVHQNPGAGITDETSSKTSCADAGCFAGAWDVRGAAVGVTFSWRVMEVLSPQSTLQDAVAFARIGVPMPSNYPNVLQAVQSVGQWLPANCGGAPCTDTSTPNAGQISVDWASAGTTQTAARTSGSPDTNQKSDWTVAASTMGADN